MVSLTGIFRRFGSPGRRIAWNREYRGKPSFIGERSSRICELVIRYGEGRDVVELACGDGSLARSLATTQFRTYTAHDVSEEAIRIAQQTALPAHLFSVSDMEDWEPIAPFELLIIEEAIYYLSKAGQRRLLARAFSASPAAKIIVTVHSATKHAATLDNCRAAAWIEEEIVEGERVYLVLASPAGGSFTINAPRAFDTVQDRLRSGQTGLDRA